MAGITPKKEIREGQLRGPRTRMGLVRRLIARRVFSWGSATALMLTGGAVVISLAADESLDFSVGQRISQPVYAKVQFEVPDIKRTDADREAARAKVPSHYVMNDPALTSGRIRADLMRLFQIAAEKSSYEDFFGAAQQIKASVDRTGYERLRELADRGEDGSRQFQDVVEKLPLEDQYVAVDLGREDRNPASAVDYIIVHQRGDAEARPPVTVAYGDVDVQKNRKSIEAVATHIGRKVTDVRLRQTIENLIVEVLREHSTIVYDKERTATAMKKAEESTPIAMTVFEANKPFIHPGILDAEEYELLRAHQTAYERFLAEDTTTLANRLRDERFYRRMGLALVVALLSVGLISYIRLYQPEALRSFVAGFRIVAVILVTLILGRLTEMNWPQYPELALAACIAAAGTLAIAYPRRFAIGVMCFVAIMLRTMLDTHLSVLLVLMAGIVVAVWQLDEIRSRSKLLVTGLVAGMATGIMSASVSLWDGQSWDFLFGHAGWAAGSTLLGAFILQGLLPFLERAFGVATSLTLLEWRDPTKPLLQLLAREAPGTYNHSLVLGTLAEAACERIGANGLLAQVGALYHDVGKIHRAAYFTENQEGRISRHENLAPSMSLLIILGHVKDGLELARQYRLPTVLHQFIAEHHGTTLVRYFHHRAVENQPRVATGRHDRDIAEADFRYEGPKPRSKESAVLMLCDAVEGAVRALNEPTVGRIESTVHAIIVERLNEGQFDDCAITMRDIRQVEDSLVKSLCGIHHGRIAYPKQRKEDAQLRPAVGASG